MKFRLFAALGGMLLLAGLFIYFATQPGRTEPEALAGCSQTVQEMVSITQEKGYQAKVFELVKNHAPIEQPSADIKLYDPELFRTMTPTKAEILEVTLTDFGVRSLAIDYFTPEGRTIVTYFENGRVHKTFREPDCSWALTNEDGEIRQIDMQAKES